MLLRGYCRKCGITYETNAVLKPITVTTDIEGAEPVLVEPGKVLVILCRCGRLVNLTPPKGTKEA
jgi:CDGSH-type Zn-finger protein